VWSIRRNPMRKERHPVTAGCRSFPQLIQPLDASGPHLRWVVMQGGVFSLHRVVMYPAHPYGLNPIQPNGQTA
jgi:hypothetical protein